MPQQTITVIPPHQGGIRAGTQASSIAFVNALNRMRGLDALQMGPRVYPDQRVAPLTPQLQTAVGQLTHMGSHTHPWEQQGAFDLYRSGAPTNVETGYLGRLFQQGTTRNPYLGQAAQQIAGSAPVNVAQQRGAEALAGAASFTPMYQRAANQTMFNTARGAFLSPASNPYFRHMAEEVRAAVQPMITSRASRAGLGAVNAPSAQRALGRGVTSAIADLAYRTYGDERSRQQQAVLATPQYAQGRFDAPRALMEAGERGRGFGIQAGKDIFRAGQIQEAETLQDLGLQRQAAEYQRGLVQQEVQNRLAAADYQRQLADQDVQRMLQAGQITYDQAQRVLEDNATRFERQRGDMLEAAQQSMAVMLGSPYQAQRQNVPDLQRTSGARFAGAATGGLGGALTGAALGNAVPGVGTAVGAVGGGLLGLLGGLFS